MIKQCAAFHWSRIRWAGFFAACVVRPGPRCTVQGRVGLVIHVALPILLEVEFPKM